MNAAYLAEGDAAFWVNGSWVWPDMQEYVDDSTDFGIMPIPKTDESMQNKINAFASKDIAIDKEMATEGSSGVPRLVSIFRGRPGCDGKSFWICGSIHQ